MTSLNSQRLEFFIAVAEELNFTRAAHRLKMTPSPLSRQIKLLEREVGGTLFARGYHDVTLTPLGQALLGPARQVMTSLETVESEARAFLQQETPLRFDASPYIPLPFLEEFTQQLHRAGVSVGTGLRLEGGTIELSRRVATGELDAALVYLPLPDEALAHGLWRQLKMSVAMRNDDPLAQAESLTLEDLRGRHVIHPVARLHPKMTEEHRALFDQAGIRAELDDPLTLGSTERAAQVWARRIACFVTRDSGAIVERVFAPPEFVVIPLAEPAFTIKLALIWSDDVRRRHPALDSVLQSLLP
jgi:DNA-binding transcriptional LysR family regulator